MPNEIFKTDYSNVSELTENNYLIWNQKIRRVHISKTSYNIITHILQHCICYCVTFLGKYKVILYQSYIEVNFLIVLNCIPYIVIIYLYRYNVSLTILICQNWFQCGRTSIWWWCSSSLVPQFLLYLQVGQLISLYA